MSRTYRLVETHIVLVPWKQCQATGLLWRSPPSKRSRPKTPDMFWDLEPGTWTWTWTWTQQCLLNKAQKFLESTVWVRSQFCESQFSLDAEAMEAAGPMPHPENIALGTCWCSCLTLRTSYWGLVGVPASPWKPSHWGLMWCTCLTLRTLHWGLVWCLHNYGMILWSS